MAKNSPTLWANILHFYQPYGQKRHIIDMIVEQCYRPIAEAVLAHSDARLTINFTGVLLDQLVEYGHKDVIDKYAEAARRGQVELIGSAKYHTILPLLPPEEAARQIQINSETNRKYFGDAYKPRGIFLPEMSWAPELAPIIEAAGFEWVALDELAYNGRVGQVDYSKLYQIKRSKLKAFFREHALSATIMSAAPRNTSGLKEAARDALGGHRYIVTGMDGETFGHHRIGHEQLLFGMFRDPEINMACVSELLSEFRDVETVPTIACTWASSEEDIAAGVQFISWNDPGNDIHKLQWKLLEASISNLRLLSHDDKSYESLRSQLDVAMASDQFFWAAARPWWSIEHIERGAFGLLDVLLHIPGISPEISSRGMDLYHEIMSKAFDWQRSGKIDSGMVARRDLIRIPYKDKTFEQGDIATWQAILELMKREENEGAARGDNESAILWRDAIYKLEHKLDVYDSMYVLDILRTKLPKGEIEETIARHKKRYDQIRGGQVEQRSN